MTKVGYKNPPVHTRFKKGVSGNPKGRPRGAKTKTANQAFEAALGHRVMVKTASGETRMSLLEAMLLNMVQQSAKGDRHARKDVLACLKLRGDLDAHPAQQRVGVVVVERPLPADDWMALAEQTRVPLDPLEGLPIDRNALARLPTREAHILPEEEED